MRWRARYPSAHPPRAVFTGLPWDLDGEDLSRGLQVFFVERFADAPGEAAPAPRAAQLPLLAEVVLFDWLAELQPALEEGGIDFTA